MADKPKDTRSLRERMKSRTADLDAAIDGGAGIGKVPAPDTDSNLRKKGNQTTDKNNSGYY